MQSLIQLTSLEPVLDLVMITSFFKKYTLPFILNFTQNTSRKSINLPENNQFCHFTFFPYSIKLITVKFITNQPVGGK